MAFMRIVYPRIVTDAFMYNEFADEIQLATKHPEGLIMHAAGEFDGKWRVVEVWYSEEYAIQFDAERLQPAFKALTGKRASHLDAEYTELHNLITP
jgi:hypothetical protein